MIGLSVEVVKEGIKVLQAAEKASVKNLGKFGAFVRERARTSIRKRKGTSGPGSPPSSHTGLLRDKILFLVEPEAHNVVIGPMLLNKVSPTALKALEHGGASLVITKGQLRAVNIAARPFMKPAFDIELEKSPDLWKDSIEE